MCAAPRRPFSSVTQIANLDLLPAEPLVSVCIVTYNQETMIRDAVDSALLQDLDAPYEIIIGDDYSTDGTRDILRRYQHAHPDRIRLNLHDEHYEGITARKNMVVNLSTARGKYIALLDGDDYWISTNKLRRQTAGFEANPEMTLSFHDAEVRYHSQEARARHAARSESIEEGRRFSNRCSPALSQDKWFTHEEMIHGRCNEGLFYVPASSVMFRRSSFCPVPDWFWNVYFADKVMQVYLSQQGRTRYYRDLLSCRRFTTQSVSTKPLTIPETNLLIQESHILREVCPGYKAHGMLSAAYLWQMRHWLRESHYRRAFSCLMRALPNYFNLRFQQAVRWLTSALPAKS